MQQWIAEADVYRLEKAYRDASAPERERIAHHLRQALARLEAVAGTSQALIHRRLYFASMRMDCAGR